MAEGSRAGSGLGSAFRALGERDFALLWWGQSVSQLGDGVFTVALALETLHVDDRPGALGVVLAARTVPTLLFLVLGGVVVDRVARRTAMLISDAVRGVIVGVFAIVVAAGGADITLLVVLSIVFGTADAFFSPAIGAIVAEVLPPEMLVQGNSLTTASSQLTQSLAGPAVGGILVGLIGMAWSFGLDALSFAASIVGLAAMGARRRPARSGNSILGDAQVGFRFILERRWLLLSIIAGGLANFFGLAPFGVLLPLLVRQVLHADALALGLALGAGGAGGLLASLLVARLRAPRNRITVMWAAYGLSGLAVVCMAVAPDLWVVAATSAAAVGLIVYGDVQFVSMMQSSIPSDMLGRTFSVLQLLAFGLTPIGTVAAGFVAGTVGIRTTMAASAALATLTACVVVLPGARDPDLGPAARYPV